MFHKKNKVMDKSKKLYLIITKFSELSSLFYVMDAKKQQDLELFTCAENNDLCSVDKQSGLKQFLVILNCCQNVPVPVLLNTGDQSGI
jgi:hypothetical protein